MIGLKNGQGTSAQASDFYTPNFSLREQKGVYLHLGEEERHIEREGEQRSAAPHVVVAYLQGMLHVVVLWVLQNRLHRLGIA